MHNKQPDVTISTLGYDSTFINVPWHLYLTLISALLFTFIVLIVNYLTGHDIAKSIPFILKPLLLVFIAYLFTMYLFYYKTVHYDISFEFYDTHVLITSRHTYANQVSTYSIEYSDVTKIRDIYRPSEFRIYGKMTVRSRVTSDNSSMLKTTYHDNGLFLMDTHVSSNYLDIVKELEKRTGVECLPS